jgi:hypothetical protein
LSSVIRQSISIKESQAKGVPLIQMDPACRGAADYSVLAQEIIAKTAPEVESTSRLAEPSRSNASQVNLLRDFVITAGEAKEVYLVGDFNNWAVTPESLLWQKEQGVWEKRLFLEPGRYRYKFLVDGRWTTDPNNDILEPNPYGGHDSVLDI